MIDGAGAFDIAASGMSAARTDLDVIAQNIANASTMRGAGLAPYRSRVAVFEPASVSPFGAALDSALGDVTISFEDEQTAAQGVRLAGIVERASMPQYRYDPTNPLAARSGPQRGYVAMPDVDPIEQMVALVAAGRTYDADVSVLNAAKQMDAEASDIARL